MHLSPGHGRVFPMPLHRLVMRTTVTGAVVAGYVTQMIIPAPSNCNVAAQAEYCGWPLNVAERYDDEPTDALRGADNYSFIGSTGASGISVPYERGVSVNGNAYVNGFRIIPTHPNPSHVPKPPKRILFRVELPRDD